MQKAFNYRTTETSVSVVSPTNVANDRPGGYEISPSSSIPPIFTKALSHFATPPL